MKLFVRCLLLVAGAQLGFGCRSVYQKQEAVMGPIIARITAVSSRMPAPKVESAVQAAFAEVHKIDALMSHYKTDSDITRLNESGADTWIQVHPLTFAVLEESQKIAKLTGGAFDATVQPLSTLWGFWPILQLTIPSEEEVQQVRSHVGYKKLSLDRSKYAVEKSDPEVKVDLGGIAKGYAVDKAMQVLRREGLRHALVEIGGETRAMGKNKKGKPWRIGVLHPSQRRFLTILDLSNKAVATSGDYMSFFIVDGKRYSHLIDPRTGKPISNDVCSVTVIADNCTQADALATAVSVMGVEDGMKLIESLPATEAIIARRKDAEKEIEVRVSSGLKGLKLTP